MGVRWVSDGCPMGVRWVSDGCQMGVIIQFCTCMKRGKSVSCTSLVNTFIMRPTGFL